jgi:hypothetical protein
MALIPPLENRKLGKKIIRCESDPILDADPPAQGGGQYLPNDKHCLNGAPENHRRNCPRFSGIAVPELLKSLSANYRNRCPVITETRIQE